MNHMQPYFQLHSTLTTMHFTKNPVIRDRTKHFKYLHCLISVAILFSTAKMIKYSHTYTSSVLENQTFTEESK